MKIIVDTSVIVDHIRADVGVYPSLIALARKGSVKLYIPTVVVLELWKGRSMGDKNIEKSVDKLLQAVTILPLSRQLAKEAGCLMRKGLVDNFIDAVVAATALYLDARLATANKKHFVKVKDLRLFD